MCECQRTCVSIGPLAWISVPSVPISRRRDGFSGLPAFLVQSQRNISNGPRLEIDQRHRLREGPGAPLSPNVPRRAEYYSAADKRYSVFSALMWGRGGKLPRCRRSQAAHVVARQAARIQFQAERINAMKKTRAPFSSGRNILMKYELSKGET